MIEVSGELWAVSVDREKGAPVQLTVPPHVGATAEAPPVRGMVIVPPMPGRILEVRVHEGQAVEKGMVLLVLEAMKMRNEVSAPVSGVVRDLRVREGANVRAREAMLTVAPP